MWLIIEWYTNGVWCKAVNVENGNGRKCRHIRENNINIVMCPVWNVFLITLLRIRSIVRYL